VRSNSPKSNKRSVSFRELGVWEKEEFRKLQIHEYGDSMHKAGYFPTEADAHQHALESMRLLWAENSKEKPHYFWSIMNDEKDVGFLWVAENTRFNNAYIYQITIFEEFRRKGLAREALVKLSADLKAKGIDYLSLNVFAYNPGARALYEEVGFQDAAHSMRLRLQD